MREVIHSQHEQAVRDIPPEPEHALVWSEKKFRTLIENSPDVIALTDAQGTILYESPSLQRILGFGPDELVGRSVFELAHPDDHEWLARLLDQLVAEPDKPRTGEFRHLHKNGTYVWMEGVVSNMLAEPAIQAIVCNFRDITERQKSEEALRASASRRRLALQSARMGFYERDVAANQSTCDEQCRAILGLPEDVSDPAAFRGLLHPEDRAFVCRAVERMLNPGIRKMAKGEFRIRRPDGEVRWVAASGCALFDDSASPPRPLTLMGVVRDITDRKLAERELEEARERLARANQDLERTMAERTAQLREAIAELEHMSYTIIHDLRAPLRAMMGYGELVRLESGACLSERSRGFLQQIMASASRMDLLITDALNYNRVVRTNLPLAPVDPGRLLESMLKSYPEFQPLRAQIQLEGAFPRVLGNEAGLTQVFSNLLSNAVKFVRPGEVPRVRIWAERRPETQGAPRVRLSFQDNGVGIPGEGLEHIFDMFQRLHGSDYEGTGIGLALVRKAVERMGGGVGVESEPGQGSRFWVELRAAQA